MARILILGSFKHAPSDPDRERCRQAAQKIGAALARWGHTLIVGSGEPSNAEYWVLKGAEAEAKPRQKKLSAIAFSPRDRGVASEAEPDDPNARLNWPSVKFIERIHPNTNWSVGGPVVLMHTDLVLHIGGGDYARDVALIAAEVKKPVYAVDKLGGSSEKIFELQRAKYEALGLPQSSIIQEPDKEDFGDAVARGIAGLLRSQSGRMRYKLLAYSFLGAALVFLAQYALVHISLKELKAVASVLAGTCAGILGAYVLRTVVLHDGGDEPMINRLAVALFLGTVGGLLFVDAAGIYQQTLDQLDGNALAHLLGAAFLAGIAIGFFHDRSLETVLDALKARLA